MLGKELLLDSELDELTMRSVNMEDADRVMEVLDAAAIAARGKPDTSRSQLLTDWQTPGWSLADNVQVIEAADGRLAGYIEVWDLRTPPVQIWTWLRIHPEFERSEAGFRLLEWAERRCRTALPRASEELRVVMHAGAYSTHQPSGRLLGGYGMKVVRHFWTMSIDLNGAPPSPTWPERIVVQAMRDDSELSAIITATRDAFQDHWGSVESSFDDELARWQHIVAHEESFDRSLWFMAMDGDEIAGISLCWPEHYGDATIGWVGTLGVLRPWRRRGLGLALLQHSFGEFYRRGKKQVGLGVDSSNLTGATRLYERAGMHVTEQMDLYEKELRPGRVIARQSLD
jgi:ribosomal protein S18 acetylase RimI-like enzyme